MFAVLTPARRRGVELLDDPATPADIRIRAMRDVERSNRLFGGARAALMALTKALPTLPREAVLLDVGSGTADITAAARERARGTGVALTCIGIDRSESLLRASIARLDGGVVADASALPFRSGAVDVVLCSQLLHHFDTSDAVRVLGELDRVARARVIVADIQRSWLAAIGFWLAALALRWHPITRHDGVVSVFRGFTASELRALVQQITSSEPQLRRGIFWRLTAAWAPSPPDR
jgi:ubiquinone/menaquinone biosynthesis C-methylase UbiE